MESTDLSRNGEGRQYRRRLTPTHYSLSPYPLTYH